MLSVVQDGERLVDPILPDCRVRRLDRAGAVGGGNLPAVNGGLSLPTYSLAMKRTVLPVAALALLLGAGAACSSTSAAPIATQVVPPTRNTATAGGANRFAGPTTGTIQSIDGSTLVLKTSDGSTVNLSLDDQTVVRKMAKATLADLKNGDLVAVRGDADAQGKITARTVQIVPAGTRPFGGGNGGNGPNGGGARQGGQAGQGQAGQTPRGGQAAAGATPGAGNRAGNGNRPAGVAFGTVQSVSGDQVTIQTQGGGTETVTVPGSATIQRVTDGARSDLQTGETISAVAPQGGAARTITIEAAA